MTINLTTRNSGLPKNPEKSIDTIPLNTKLQLQNIVLSGLIEIARMFNIESFTHIRNYADDTATIDRVLQECNKTEDLSILKLGTYRDSRNPAFILCLKEDENYILYKPGRILAGNRLGFNYRPAYLQEPETVTRRFQLEQDRGVELFISKEEIARFKTLLSRESPKTRNNLESMELNDIAIIQYMLLYSSIFNTNIPKQLSTKTSNTPSISITPQTVSEETLQKYRTRFFKI